MNAAQEQVWGLWDTVDGLWMGSDDGPFLYHVDEQLAILMAEVTSRVVGWDATRVRPRLYDNSATRIRDEVRVTRTPLAVIRDIERGVL